MASPGHQPGAHQPTGHQPTGHLPSGGSSVGATLAVIGQKKESRVFAGGIELYIRLNGDTWVDPLTNTIKQAIIDGLDAASSPVNGWNNVVRDGLTVPHVTRLSDTTVRVELPAFSGYSVSANEIVQMTVPATAVTGAAEITATPTFTIVADTLTGTAIVNADSTNEAPSHYEICDRTGFRVKRGTLMKEWNGLMVRPESYERRHPQDFLRAGRDNQRGSPRPEQTDSFIEDTFPNRVLASDL